MRASAGIILTALAAITIAACAGSSPRNTEPAPSVSIPPISAAAACSGFASWRKQTQGNPTDWNKRLILLLATSQAPSGRLFSDLFTLESDVITAHAVGSVGKAYENMIPAAIAAVARDCQSVNLDS